MSSLRIKQPPHEPPIDRAQFFDRLKASRQDSRPTNVKGMFGNHLVKMTGAPLFSNDQALLDYIRSLQADDLLGAHGPPLS
jgi:hypothetical protein